MLFHKDVHELSKIDKGVEQATKDLKEMLQTYHLKIILVQELITALRGSKEDETKIDPILTRLSEIVDKDETLAQNERTFAKTAEPILKKLIEHEKDAGQKKKEQDIVEALGYLTQDLERADSIVSQQKNMLTPGNRARLHHSDEAHKLAEFAKQEAVILFGIDGRQSSEEQVIKDIGVRIKELLEKKNS